MTYEKILRGKGWSNYGLNEHLCLIKSHTLHKSGNSGEIKMLTIKITALENHTAVQMVAAYF